MSLRESNLADCLLEDALDEVFHSGPDAALVERILSRARTGTGEVAIPAAPTGQPHVAPLADPAPVLRALPKPRRWWRYAVEAAIAASLIALIAVLVVPRKPLEPPGVIAFSGADYEYMHQADIPEVSVQSGWYVLQDGAPDFRAGSSRVQDVKGQVIVRVGEVPSQTELAAMGPWLSEHQIEVEEIDMLNGTWIKAGTLAVFLVAGSAFVDGNFLQAQEREGRKKEGERKEVERKEVERKEGERKEPERPAAELERLRKEVEELKKRAEEARELENERERKARLERIEKAMKEKRERIAELEGKNGRGGAEGRNGHGGPEGKNGRGGAEGRNGHGGPEGKNGRGGAEGRNGPEGERDRKAEGQRREKEAAETERKRAADKPEAERKREPERKERKQ